MKFVSPRFFPAPTQAKVSPAKALKNKQMLLSTFRRIEAHSLRDLTYYKHYIYVNV